MITVLVLTAVVAAAAALAIAYVMTRSPSGELVELAAEMTAQRAGERADVDAQAARIAELAQRGEIEDADVATAQLLFELIRRDPPPGADVAAVRALAAMAAAYVERDAEDDLDRTVGAIEANRERLGGEATALAVARLRGIAISLAIRGRGDQAERVRAVQDALATRSPGSGS